MHPQSYNDNDCRRCKTGCGRNNWMNRDNVIFRRRMTSISLLSAAGAVVFIFEAFIPSPLPWMKLGLSNIAVLLAIYYFGILEGIAVSLLRLTAGSLFTGTLFSPGFIFGLGGGVFSVLTMWGLKNIDRRLISPVGISIGGSAGHTFGQLIIANILFIRNSSVWHLLPLMTIISVFTGALTGMAALVLIERVFSQGKNPHKNL